MKSQNKIVGKIFTPSETNNPDFGKAFMIDRVLNGYVYYHDQDGKHYEGKDYNVMDRIEKGIWVPANN